MPEVPQVSCRDARRQDAAAIGKVWAAASPQLVRSAERAGADMNEDATLGRRRYVGVLDDVVVGTATVRRTSEDTAFLSVEVHPDNRSRGVGTALIAAVLTAFPEVTDLVAVSSEDPVALAFAVRNGFLPDSEGLLLHIDPASVAPAEQVPDGLTASRLDLLSDLSAVVETHNLAARDDPSGLSQQYTVETFLADWWNSPDNAPELSWALLDESAGRTVVASFTSVQVDRVRRRSWSAMTVTHPSYRARGLARWVQQRMLNSVARAGITDAVTASDSTNEPMIAINDALGYRPAGRFVRVRRRLPR